MSDNEFYKNLFKDKKGIKVFTEPAPTFKSNHWLSCILVDPEKTDLSSENIRQSLAEDHIESRPLWKPMHLQPVFKQAPCYGGSVSENLFRNGLCLPSGSNLKQSELQRISSVIKQMK